MTNECCRKTAEEILDAFGNDEIDRMGHVYSDSGYCSSVYKKYKELRQKWGLSEKD